jgi:ribosomal protein S18 acetylase RimI-like enzyme
MQIIQISPDRWHEYKSIRLEALNDNPYAFDSSPDEENFTDEHWQEKLKEPNDFKIFAEDNGKLVAKMEVEWDMRKKIKHNAEIYGVYINPEYRGQGLGKLLMDEVEKVAKEHGITRLWLDVVVTQEAAMKLYRTSGFREIGRTEKSIQVDNTYYDKLLMEKLI